MIHPGRTPHLPSDALLARYAPLAPMEPGSPVRVHFAPNVFTLWEAWEAEAGGEQEVPYWSVPWPAGAVLARYVLANPSLVAGRTVLDLGCGGACEAVAARLAGATRVVANDWDPVALEIARRNAAANGVELEYDGRDLTRIPQEWHPQVVLVGDLFYEREPAARLLAFLHDCRRAGADVLLADAHRPYAPHHGVDILAMEDKAVDRDLDGVPVRTVRIMRLLP